MISGRIKCFFESKGYGYIEDFDGREVYFHLSVIENTGEITNGVSVYFDAINTEMGLEALSVQLADSRCA